MKNSKQTNDNASNVILANGALPDECGDSLWEQVLVQNNDSTKTAYYSKNLELADPINTADQKRAEAK